ncbi:DUF4190 domain-containing protein [Kribbella sp. NPDC049174]|uniref:DUF4190 domain-containing protein n=1 Tax=Kribbella sp. NPDC049174 TaxID=3364112 RepID=UPI00372122E4
MESTPPSDGDPGTPSSGQPPYAGPPQHPGQQYAGQQQYPGQQQHPGQYAGPPQYPGQQPYSGMPPVQGMPHGPQYPGQPQKTSTPAILSLVFGIVGAILISVILGIVALSKISHNGQKGKGLAIAGLVISGVWAVGLVGLAVVFGDGEPDRDASGQVTTTQNARADKLRVGDCVSTIAEAAEVRDLELVPCDQPNGGKVFAVFDLPAGKWPGLTAVQTAAEKGCVDRWAATGEQLDDASDIIYLHPIETGWSLGDRGTTCLVTPK